MCLNGAPVGPGGNNDPITSGEEYDKWYEETFVPTMDNTAVLTAELLVRYGLTPDKVLQHTDVYYFNIKQCPYYMRLDENKQLVEDLKALGITKICEGTTAGPDGIVFSNAKATRVGDNILFPVSIGLYGITAALAVIVMIFAIKDKPRKYIYILLTVLIGVFFEIFGWNRRAFIAFNSSDSILTFALVLVLFAIGGALMTTGAKKRILCAVICPVIWGAMYVLTYFAFNAFLGGANAFIIGTVYILAGIESIVMLAITMKNIIRSRKGN